MLIGIDQGTTGTTVVAYNAQLQPIAEAYRPLPTAYLRPGCVEQDAEDVITGVVDATAQVLARIGGPSAVTAVGLANQGETIVAWDSTTGRALTPAIVWSDGRGASVTAPLRAAGHAERVRAVTGLELDPYFSASKMAWLLAHDRAVQAAAAGHRLRIGTLDTWLAWRLGGRQPLTDHSTASRTQLFALDGATWTPELLDLFGIPLELLAAVRPSVGDWGTLAHPDWHGALPWRASLVDQPAALVGNGCVTPGTVKATYGTGCFILVNAGSSPPAPVRGLLTSIAWSTADHRTYAYDGGVFSAGTMLTWLVSVGIVADVAHTAALAESVPDTGGVRLLPALTGLGAPWWDNDARGVFSGITNSTTSAHLVRATLDAIAFRVRDVLEAAWSAGQARPVALRVDGGMTKNRYLMQRQADVLGLPVEHAAHPESTARGAAALAGIGANVLDETAVRELIPVATRYEPRTPQQQCDEEYAQWCTWLAQARRL